MWTQICKTKPRYEVVSVDITSTHSSLSSELGSTVQHSPVVKDYRTLVTLGHKSDSLTKALARLQLEPVLVLLVAQDFVEFTDAVSTSSSKTSDVFTLQHHTTDRVDRTRLQCPLGQHYSIAIASARLREDGSLDSVTRLAEVVQVVC